MRLYLARGDLAFSSLRPVPEGAWRWRGGAPVAHDWDEPRLTACDGAPGEFIPVDCMAMSTGIDGFILSDFAREALDLLLRSAGEFWPVSVCGRRYWWFNCLASLEALDRRRTDADWSTVEGSWGSFRWITTTRRLAFQASKIRAAPVVFRVPEYPQGVLFSTERLDEAVVRHGLTGFRFDLIWSSRDGGVSDPPGVGLGGVFDDVPRNELERKRSDAKATLERRRQVD